jgi:hypothetical protein
MNLTPEDINNASATIFWSFIEDKISLAQLIIKVQRIKKKWNERDNK